MIFWSAKNEFKNRQRKDENYLIRPCAWDITRLKINSDHLHCKPSAAGRHLIRRWLGTRTEARRWRRVSLENVRLHQRARFSNTNSTTLLYHCVTKMFNVATNGWSEEAVFAPNDHNILLGVCLFLITVVGESRSSRVIWLMTSASLWLRGMLWWSSWEVAIML